MRACATLGTARGITTTNSVGAQRNTQSYDRIPLERTPAKWLTSAYMFFSPCAAVSASTFVTRTRTTLPKLAIAKSRPTA